MGSDVSPPLMEEDSVSVSSSSSSELSSSLHSLSAVAAAVAECKQHVLETSEGSDERRELVKQLIRLRIREFDLKQREDDDTVEMCGHVLVSSPHFASSAKLWCDVCAFAVWQYLQSFKTCSQCSLVVHDACLVHLRRECVMLKVHADPVLITAICPEQNLANLEYRCAECKKKLAADQSRLCDYTGLSFCKQCHWKELRPIPARILHNWDFTPREVSQAAKQYLDLMLTKPVIDVKMENDTLFALVPELNVIQEQRERLMQMKRYLAVCRIASEQKLLLRLQPRQHYVDSADYYSIQDLCDVHNGSLGPFLDQIIQGFVEHIDQCVLCKAKGYICELCNDSSHLLFPFQEMVIACSECETVFHKECFKRLRNECPRCERRRNRQLSRIEENSM